MTHISVELPESVFAAMQQSPAALGEEMRLLSALHWYRQGRIPQEAVASVAGQEQADLAKMENEMRLASAAHLYQQGVVSQGTAANLAGLNRRDFLLTLGKMKVDALQVDFDDLDRELARDEHLARGAARDNNPGHEVIRD